MTFDLLTSGSVHAEVMLWTVFLPSLMLIAQAIFLLERGQTDKETRLNAPPMPLHFAVYETRRIFLSPFVSKASRCVFSFFLIVQLSQPYVATGHRLLALSLVVSSLKSVCCDFSVFSAVSHCLTWYGIPSYTHHLL